MMKTRQTAWQRVSCATLLALSASLSVSLPAWADDDSSADSPNAFSKKVEASEAVVLRVPINESGEELTDAATMRLYDGTPVTGGAAIQSAFDRGLDVGSQPQVTADDIARDSSTRGWYRYSYNGWYSNYYYNYQPYYYSYGNYYNYGTPYYYNYYNPNTYYWGYRYYYYPRYW